MINYEEARIKLTKAQVKTNYEEARIKLTKVQLTNWNLQRGATEE